MKPSKTVGRIVALVAAALFASGVAWAGLVGVITAVSKSTVTVSGAVYDLDGNTNLEDMSGHPIKFRELRPGITVELEFDETGRLATLRAAVVR